MLDFDGGEEEFLLHRRVSLAVISLSPIVVFILLGIRPPTYGKHLVAKNAEANTIYDSSDTTLPPPPKNAVETLSPSLRRRMRPSVVSNSREEETTDTDPRQQRQQQKQKQQDQHQQKTHHTRHWLGPLLPTKWSWVFFESPNCLWVIACVLDRSYRSGAINSNDNANASTNTALPAANKILLAWFFFHYLYRSVWYPLVAMNYKTNHIRDRGMPLGIVLIAWFYCAANGYLQARGLTRFQTSVPIRYEGDDGFSSLLLACRFWVGVSCMVGGFCITVTSDRILLALKQKQGKRRQRHNRHGYAIPYGGLFRWVSSPHYFGELVEWTGFFVASGGSLAAFSFVVWTAANLVPRAILTHEWYLDTFCAANGGTNNGDKNISDGAKEENHRDDYSKLGRKAIVPFLL